MDIITSGQNKIVKLVRMLREKKHRQAEGFFVVEGDKFVNEIPAEWEIKCFVLSQNFANKTDFARFESVAAAYVAADSVFETMADTVSPQGVLAIVRQRVFKTEEILGGKRPLILMLDGINDPGNLGTIMRLAQSACVDGVLLSRDCVDIYNPKVVRAAAGSFFNLKFVYADLAKAAELIKAHGIKILASMPAEACSLYEMDLKQPLAFLIGNEARGISPVMAQLADMRVKIPMIGAAESLNASMACGIMVYEVLRQRHWA